jgi:hypothetical protein
MHITLHAERSCRRVSIALLMQLLATLACGPMSADRGSFVARDSSGIRLVENASPEWTPDSAWQLDSVPFLSFGSIGVAEGDSTQLLTQVMSATRLAADTIVLVNAGTAEVRWYDSTGHLIRSVGRKGAGPAEFSQYGPGTLCRMPGDRIVVGDPMQQRAHIFTTTGEFVQVIRVASNAVFPSVQGCFSDGSLLGWHSSGPAERIPGRIIESNFTWTRLAADGSPLTELLTLPGAQQYLLDQGNGIATYHAIPFNVRPSAAAATDRVYVAPGATPVIQMRGLDGALQSLIRWKPEALTRSEDVLAQFRSYMVDNQGSPERRAAWEKFFDLKVAIPPEIATVQSRVVDDLSHLWVERYRLPWDSVPRWEVFDPDGRWLGGLTLPTKFRPMHIGTDFVLGVSRGELGVERIQLHRLQRKDGTRS